MRDGTGTEVADGLIDPAIRWRASAAAYAIRVPGQMYGAQVFALGMSMCLPDSVDIGGLVNVKRGARRSLCWLVLLLLIGCGHDARSGAERIVPEDLAADSVSGAAPSVENSHAFLLPPMKSDADSGMRAQGATFGFRAHRQYLRALDDPMGIADDESVAALDINGDGRDDLVTFSSQGFVGVLLQQRDGTLSAPIAFSNGPETYRASIRWVLADFNEDRITDVAFETTDEHGTRGGVGLLLSRAGANPVFHQGYPAMGDLGDWASLDVDGDGHQDVVTLRSDSDPSSGWETNFYLHYEILHGDGKGNFGRRQIGRLDLDAFIHVALAVDIDGDGLDDLVFSTYEPGNQLPGRLWVSHRLSGGGLGPLRELHSLQGWHPVVFGDLNGDGLLDTIAGTEIHFREQDGSFSDAQYLATYNSVQITPHIADFDGDGLDDLVNHQFEGFFSIPFLAVYMGGGGTLQAPFRIYDPPYNHMFKVSPHRYPYASGDFNGDGCRDLAVAVGYDGVAVLDGYNCVGRPRGTGGKLPGRRKR